MLTIFFLSFLLFFSGEIKRLNYEKCRAEDRAREAIREGNMIRKKRIVNNDITINTSTTTTNTTSNSNTRSNAPVKSILKFSTKNTNNTTPGTGTVAKSTRYLSQDDIKTKKWLLTNINKIIDNENNVTLYNKLNIQLTSLIQQKDDLDTTKKRLIDVPEPENSSEIDEINDKLNIIEQQIKLKTIHINKIKSQIDNNDDTEDIYEKTIDNMKRNISLNLLRLLFEMVVKGKRV